MPLSISQLEHVAAFSEARIHDNPDQPIGLSGQQKPVDQTIMAEAGKTTWGDLATFSYWSRWAVKSTMDTAKITLKEQLEECATASGEFAKSKVVVVLSPEMTCREVYEQTQKLIHSDWGQMQSIRKSVTDFLDQLDQVRDLRDESDHTKSTLNYFKGKLLQSFEAKLKNAKDKTLFRRKLLELSQEHGDRGVSDVRDTHFTLTNRLLNGLADLSVEPIDLDKLPALPGRQDRNDEYARFLIKSTLEMCTRGFRGDRLRIYATEAAEKLEATVRESGKSRLGKIALIKELKHAFLKEIRAKNKNLSEENKALDPLLNMLEALERITAGSPEPETHSSLACVNLSNALLDEPEQYAHADTPDSSLSSLQRHSMDQWHQQLHSLPDSGKDQAVHSLNRDLLSEVSQLPQNRQKQVYEAAAKNFQQMSLTPVRVKPVAAEEAPVQLLVRRIAMDCRSGYVSEMQADQWRQLLIQSTRHLPRDAQHTEQLRIASELERFVFEHQDEYIWVTANWDFIKHQLNIPAPVSTTVPVKGVESQDFVEPFPGAQERDDTELIQHLWFQISKDISRMGYAEEIKAVEGWGQLLEQLKMMYPANQHQAIHDNIRAGIMFELDNHAQFPVFNKYRKQVEALFTPRGDLEIPPSDTPSAAAKPVATVTEPEVPPAGFDQTIHLAFAEDLFTDIRRNLILNPVDAHNRLAAWHGHLKTYVMSFPPHERAQINELIADGVRERLRQELNDHPHIADFMPMIDRLFLNAEAEAFQPAPVQVAALSRTEQPQGPASLQEPLEWPAIHGPNLMRQQRILLATPDHYYVGMDPYGNLVYSEHNSPAFHMHMDRLKRSMDSYLYNVIIPAVGSDWTPKHQLQLFLPEYSGDCRVGALKNTLARVQSNPNALRVLHTAPPAQAVQQRFTECNGKVMVIGCGPSRKEHEHVHPHRTSFTADLAPEALADLTGDINSTIHQLPNAGNFATIYFEHIDSSVFKDPVVADALLKKCYRLLKPGGMLIISTGTASLYSKENFDVREQIVQEITGAGFDEFKYTTLKGTLAAFETIDPATDIQPQLPAIYEAAPVIGNTIPRDRFEMLNIGFDILAVKPER